MKKKRLRADARSGKQAQEALKNLQKRQSEGTRAAEVFARGDEPAVVSRVTRGKLSKTAARRRRARQKAIMTVVVAILIIAGMIASFVLIFRLSAFEVEGESIYSDQELIATVPILLEENIFSFSIEDAQRAILEKFIYIENVEVRRKLPSTILISVEPAVERYMIEVEQQRYVLSETLKVLRVAQDGEMFAGIVGLEPQTPVVGENISSTDENRQHMLELLIQELKEVKILEQITEINVTDTLNLEVVYDGRIDIFFGSDLSMEYKMQMVAKVLNENIQSNESGSIDASVSGRAVFKSA